MRTADGRKPDPAQVAGCVTDAASKAADSACLAARGIVTFAEAF